MWRMLCAMLVTAWTSATRLTRTPALPNAQRYRAGQIIGTFHSFPFDGDLRSLSGVFREMVAFDGPAGAPQLFVGRQPLRCSYAPTCVLAPSMDGGATRLLVCIMDANDVEGPLPWSVLFGALDNATLQVAHSAAELATSSMVDAVELGRDENRVAVTPGKGRGVLAGRDFAAGELVEECLAVCVDSADVPECLSNYMFYGRTPGTRIVLFGHGMLYNHGNEPTIRPVVPSAPLRIGESNTVAFVAARDIVEGEELLQSYGERWWQSRKLKPL